jgi:pimeloyl-ACP methyl ester carboxylesterase
VDLPGHGDSPLPHGSAAPGVTRLTDLVAGLLTELAPTRPVVVGNSLGGAIALELFRRGAARAVVVLAPIGFWSRWEVSYAVTVLRTGRALARLLDPCLPALLQRPAFRALTLWPFYAHPRRLDPGPLTDAVRHFASAPGLPAILPWSRRHRLTSTAALDRAAVTIAWGSHDRLLVGGQAARARRLLPGARHVRLDGCGHVPMVDDPGRIAALVLDS